MLPYWYKQMIENQQGRTFQRGKGGENLIYKHEKFFVIGNFENGYHPIINIRLWIFVKYLCYFLRLSISAWCRGRRRTCLQLFGTNYMLTLWKLVRLPTHHTGDLLIIGISKQKNICSPGVFSVEEILPCISVGMLVLVIVSARWYRNKYYSGGSSKLKETENIIVNNIKLRNIAVISDSV